MLIKENSNLRKNIKNYEANKPLSIEEEILRRLTIFTATALIIWVCSPDIAYVLYNLFDGYKSSLQLLLGMTVSIGVVMQATIMKIRNKKYEIAKKNLQLIVDLIHSKNIQIDINNIANSTIDEQTTKTIIGEGIFSKEITETTITNFYLLDRDEKIRVLKETKKTIKKFGQITTTDPNLYLEEKVNEQELPVAKTLKLK